MALGDWDLYQEFLKNMREGRDGDPAYEGSQAKAFDLLLAEMFSCDAFGGLLREEAAKISQMSDDTRGNVLSGIRTHLDFLKDPLLWPALSAGSVDGPTFNLADLRDQQRFTTVYICLPVDMMYQQGRWMRLLVMQISQYIQRTSFNKATDRSLLMMIDEFFQLGPIPAIENTLTYAPGFGLRLWLIVQDLGQLKKNYPDSWETILGACGIKQFFGINDLQTAKYLSELLGDEEIDVPSVNMTKNMSVAVGTNVATTHSISESRGSSSNSSFTSGTSTGGGVVGSASNSSTHGYSSSDGVAFSRSLTEGSNVTKTEGVSHGYSISKKERRLFKPDETMTAFTRDNLAQLVHVRDHGGMVLMRTPYYADPLMKDLVAESDP